MHDEASILIIDNDTKNIELQKEWLEPYNYAILTASNVPPLKKATLSRYAWKRRNAANPAETIA